MISLYELNLSIAKALGLRTEGLTKVTIEIKQDEVPIVKAEYVELAPDRFERAMRLFRLEQIGKTGYSLGDVEPDMDGLVDVTSFADPVQKLVRPPT